MSGLQHQQGGACGPRRSTPGAPLRDAAVDAETPQWCMPCGQPRTGLSPGWEVQPEVCNPVGPHLCRTN